MNSKSSRSKPSAPEVSGRWADSPVGPLTLWASEVGLRRIDFGRHELGRVEAGGRGGATAILERACAELEEYFHGQRQQFDVALDPYGTGFQRAVWRALLAVPYGCTISYRELALAANRPAAIRAAGAANGANPLPIVVPCHRVVGSDGSLTGYGGGIDAKRWLLDLEARATVRDASQS